MRAWSRGHPQAVDQSSSRRWAHPRPLRFGRAADRASLVEPWGIWSFAPIFAIYDQQADTFHPDLLAALID